MASKNHFEWDGMEEFKALLRQLPEDLSQEGGDIVVEHAREAADDIRGHYAAAAVTGNLEKHVKVTVEANRSGATAIVKSTAKHAYIYEIGTQLREHKSGKGVGAMPPGNVFIPIMIRARRAMTEALVALLERAGLEVRRAA